MGKKNKNGKHQFHNQHTGGHYGSNSNMGSLL